MCYLYNIGFINLTINTSSKDGIFDKEVETLMSGYVGTPTERESKFIQDISRKGELPVDQLLGF